MQLQVIVISGIHADIIRLSSCPGGIRICQLEVNTPGLREVPGYGWKGWESLQFPTPLKTINGQKRGGRSTEERAEKQDQLGRSDTDTGKSVLVTGKVAHLPPPEETGQEPGRAPGKGVAGKHRPKASEADWG